MKKIAYSPDAIEKIQKIERQDERIYRCECGNCMDRDVNAAVNIREEGRRILQTA